MTAFISSIKSSFFVENKFSQWITDNSVHFLATIFRLKNVYFHFFPNLGRRKSADSFPPIISLNNFGFVFEVMRVFSKETFLVGAFFSKGSVHPELLNSKLIEY